MGNDRLKENLGCDRCWPPSADAAWEARRQLIRGNPLIDELHYGVWILTCSACSQHFISIFTEEIDWADGDDSQYWIVMPLTQQEAADIAGRGGSLTEEGLNSLASDRRSLRRDYPKGADVPRLFWASGVSIPPHD